MNYALAPKAYPVCEVPWLAITASKEWGTMYKHVKIDTSTTQSKAIITAHFEGKTTREIALEVGVATHTVRKALKRIKLAPNKAPVRKEGASAQIPELIDSGLSIVEVARKLNLHSSTVQRHVKKLGKTTRRFADHDKIIEMYLLGATKQAIASYFKFSIHTIEDHIIEYRATLPRGETQCPTKES